MRIYHLFISHSWRYGDAYVKLISLLRNDRSFVFRDYSVPKINPILGMRSDKSLSLAIREKMSHSTVVVVLAGVYATYSKWIDEELRIATEDFDPKKPIVAVAPWGSQKTSVPVKRVADRIVQWNKRSILRGIREVVK